MSAGLSSGLHEDVSSQAEFAPSLPDDRLLRASEVQKELGVSRATAYRMMNDGTLPIYRFGGKNGRRAMIRVSSRELRGWIAAQKSEQIQRSRATC